eukprot:jgi/Ulvmu1/6944/UM033_0001.1
MTTASQLRRSGRSQKPEGALKEKSSDSSDSEDGQQDDEDQLEFKDLDRKKGKTAKPGATKRPPRNRKPAAHKQANKDSDVQHQPVIAVAIDDLVGRVEKDCQRFVKDILLSHLDDSTEPQSAIVILLNLVAQYAGRPTEAAWTVDDYPDQTVEELAAAAMASIEAGGYDHFKLTGRNGAPRKPADRMRARKKAEQFWLMLGQAADDRGIDAQELFDPVLDLSLLLS